MSEGDEEAAVRVAVRVRPFNKREMAMSAKLCIDMSDKTTYVYDDHWEDAENPPKEFAFDFSLWSHYDMANDPSGPTPDRPDRPNVDQQYLFDTIGRGLLNDLWDGFDVCMFAYGQSGSGKSFSMTGTGPECDPKWQGMIPRLCKGVFELCEATAAGDENISYECTASMLEIYIGDIFDLLIPSEIYNVKTRQKLEMQLEDIAGLRWLPVQNTGDVSKLLILGFSNQYKAPTGLNVDSSRGHTIYTLSVKKHIKNPKAKKKKDRIQTVETAMRLVDLAGSERTEKVLEITKADLAALLTKKYGKTMSVSDEQMAAYKTERTAEGRSINDSLTKLGTCVQTVAKYSVIENEAERNKKLGQIAWRASALTRLLRTALNGKCKTLMIAAVSPSLTEYPETTSTMRYANNIKMIKSCAVKKVATETEEQKMARRIAELEQQLKQFTEGGGAPAAGGGGEGGGGGGGAVPEEVLQQLQEMKRAEADAKNREEQMKREMEKLRSAKEQQQQAKEGPHLIALLPGDFSAGMIVVPVPTNSKITAAHASLDPKLHLHGVGVSRSKNHCTFENSDDSITLVPEEGAACMVNGSNTREPVALKHNDRVRLGGNNYFRVIIPADATDVDQVAKDELLYTYDFAKEEAMKEIMEAFGAEEDREAEEKRKAAVAEELAKHEAEFRKQQEEAQRKAEEEKRVFEEQMRRLQSQFESSANQDKEMMQRIEQERLVFEKRMRENELMLKAKLEEEEHYKQEKLKEEERGAKKRATAKAKLQYDLMDAIPFVRACNEWSAELKVDSQYEVRIVQEETADGTQQMAVSVQLRDTKTNKTETWDMDTFRTQYGQIMQDYHDNVKNIKEGRPVRLSRDSPFRISDNAITNIGNAKCMLNYIFYNLELNDKFHIVSNNGQVHGSLYVQISPVWADEAQEDEVLDAQSLFDLTTLKYLDLDISVKKVEAIPPQYACNVDVSFTFPDFIQTSIVDLEEAKIRQRTKAIQAMKKTRGVEDDDDDDFYEEESDEPVGVRGASFHTTPDYKGHDDVNVNAPIEWNKRIRVHNMTKRTIEWFKDSSLVFKVRGTGPSKDKESVLVSSSSSDNAAASAPVVQATVDGKTAQELYDELEQLKAERVTLAKSLEDAKKAAVEAEKSSQSVQDARSVALMEALEKGKSNVDAELKTEIERLRAEQQKLRQESDDKRLALERIARGDELGSVRMRIRDVSLPEKIAQQNQSNVVAEPVIRVEKQADQGAIDAAVAKAKAEYDAKLEEQRKAFENERKRAQKAEAELQIFKAEFDDGDKKGKGKENKANKNQDTAQGEEGKTTNEGDEKKSAACTIL